ncbi:MAG: NADP-dependent phosphogluconate dehydrogenase [Erysipelotrichaceae bacterium]
MTSNIGIIGLGVMGKSLTINMLNNKFKVSGYNRSENSVNQLINLNYPNFLGFTDLKQFVNSLQKPRKILLMVPAGEAVDLAINNLVPLLQEDDIVMDGGNSYFLDSERRYNELNNHHIYFFAVGISGGEEGALHGPSLMPSGDKEIYPQIKDILQTIAAKKDNQPMCAYMGPKGSGHYVKMIHNGIEYADMQLISESIQLLKNSGLNYEEISEHLLTLNQGNMKSYLLDITIDILKEKKDGKYLLDLIVDQSSNKGTGKWSSQAGLNQEVNVSLINAAFIARLMSNESILRHKYQTLSKPYKIDVEKLFNAYRIAKILIYAQGFNIYSHASHNFNYDLDLSNIASIFRAGCIIQNELLEDLMVEFKHNPQLNNILLSDNFKNYVDKYELDLKEIAANSLIQNIATPVLTSAALYLNQIQSTNVGANIIQAQRDYFGAHTFNLIDKIGSYHHDWNK